MDYVIKIQKTPYGDTELYGAYNNEQAYNEALNVCRINYPDAMIRYNLAGNVANFVLHF